jgi:ubiquinone/menaquinone biosynthesis C-methylase UbiE
MLVGAAGLGLLRLHRSGGTTGALSIREELIAALRRVDEPPNDQDVLGEAVDITTGYSRWSAVYDQPGNPVVEHEQPAVWGLLDSLPGGPVLDAACGTGRHLCHLLAGGRQVVGVDSTLAMLDRARVKAPGVGLLRGDLTAIPVGSCSMAGAVCALALEHLSDLSPAYAELYRVVAPGGWVVTSTTHPSIRSILGWGAWFVDQHGRGEVTTYPQQVSDHLNAATNAGLVLVSCQEPVIGDTAAQRLTPPEVANGGASALRGVPIVLVCYFTKPSST